MTRCDEKQIGRINLFLKAARQSLQDQGCPSEFKCPICGAVATAINNGENGIQTWCLQCNIVIAGSKNEARDSQFTFPDDSPA